MDEMIEIRLFLNPLLFFPKSNEDQKFNRRPNWPSPAARA